jgi:hypothetical protein
VLLAPAWLLGAGIALARHWDRINSILNKFATRVLQERRLILAIYSDVLSRLPRRMRVRFESLGSYVRSIVNELEERTPRPDRLADESVQLIQLVVLVYAMDDLLREGSRAARAAVGQFRETGMAGFTVGTSVFEGENANVTLGEDLSRGLRLSLPLEVLELVDSASGIGSLTRTLVERARRG